MGFRDIDGIISPGLLCLPTDTSVRPSMAIDFYSSRLTKGSDQVRPTGSSESGLEHFNDSRSDRRSHRLPEQAAIVRFLDHADRRIRRYIRAKQKLIKLLEEQKQAIIHRAVTRGLDPNVRLKPSGVEWFGDAPEHWNVLPMRRVIERTVDGPHHSPDYSDSEVPFLSARNITVDRWSLADAKFISETGLHREFCKRIMSLRLVTFFIQRVGQRVWHVQLTSDCSISSLGTRVQF